MASDVAHVPWCRTDNLSAAFLGDTGLVVGQGTTANNKLSKLNAVVCATEKIDGSNLGVHVRREAATGQWGLLALHGRRSILWAPGGGCAWVPSGSGQDVPALKYGNAGSLGKLPEAALRFATAVAEDFLGLGEVHDHPLEHVDHEGLDLPATPPVEEMIVYGEVFKRGKQQFASFHPFGLASPRRGPGEGDADPGSHETDGLQVDSEDDEDVDARWCRHKLTHTLHALFQRHAIAAPPTSSNSAASGCASAPVLGSLFQHLDNASTHVVCPPPIVFVGPLMEAVATLGPVLRTAMPDVEGVFLKAEPGEAQLFYKWKAPAHEEQQEPQTLPEVALQAHTHASTGKALSRSLLRARLMDLDDSQVDDLVAALDADVVATFQVVAEVLTCKPPTAVTRAKAGKTKAPQTKVSSKLNPEEPLHARILEAFRREMTKDQALAPGVMASIQPKHRKPVADRIAHAVVAEVEEQLCKDGETVAQHPTLRPQVEAFVRAVVFKDEVEQYRCEAGR